MNIFNLIRILFIYGRDQYERAALSPKEYEKRQNERARNGCVGCLAIVIVLIVLFGWAVSVEDRRERERVAKSTATTQIETQEEAWGNAAKSEGPIMHVTAVLTDFDPIGTFDAEYWFWTSNRKSLLLTYRRGSGWPPWPGYLPGPDDLGRQYDIEYRDVQYLNPPPDNYHVADKHVIRCIGGAIDAELHRQLRQRVR